MPLSVKRKNGDVALAGGAVRDLGTWLRWILGQQLPLELRLLPKDKKVGQETKAQ